MKLTTAMNVLIREVNFLGYQNLGELVEDLERDPGPFKLSTIQAYRTYKELAYI